MENTLNVDTEKLLSFFKEEFPKDAIDIQACIEWLNQCIAGSKDRIINIIIPKVCNNMEYQKVKLYTDLLEFLDSKKSSLDEYYDLLEINEETQQNIINDEELDSNETTPNYELLKIDSDIAYSIFEDFTYTRPHGFELFGKRYMAKDWKEVFVKTCEVLAQRDLNLFESFVNDSSMQGKKVAYFCNDIKTVVRNPVKVKGTSVFVMTNMSANSVRNVIERMLRKYKIKTSSYKIFLRADYSSLHI